MGIKYPASPLKNGIFDQHRVSSIPAEDGISASLQQAPSTHNPWRGQEIEKN
jgi:hypothetical protein